MSQWEPLTEEDPVFYLHTELYFKYRSYFTVQFKIAFSPSPPTSKLVFIQLLNY